MPIKLIKASSCSAQCFHHETLPAYFYLSGFINFSRHVWISGVSPAKFWQRKGGLLKQIFIDSKNIVMVNVIRNDYQICMHTRIWQF